jgi:PA14 domain/Glycosyl hydrolase family 26
VDINNRLIKRSAFLKMLGGMGVAMTPAASAFAYRGCATGSYYAQYYAGVNFDTLRRSQCEAAPLDKNWGGGAISPMSRANYMSARWTGDFNFQQSGEYEFTATADDGIRVYVDGVKIIDEWRDQAATTYRARKTLAAGRHEIKVEYYERWGLATCKLDWALLSTPTESAPEARILGAAITAGPFSQARYAQDIDRFNSEAGYVHPVIHTYDRFGEYGLDYGKMDVFESTNTDPIWTWEPAGVSLASINAGTHDGWIDEQARLTTRFPNRRVFIRFAHEMNGNWYPWCQQPAAYKSAFQRVYTRVKAIASNAELVWCPNIDFPITEYYPGSGYVDWLALDGYNMDGVSTPRDVLASDYDIVCSLDATKPFMIAETGCMEYTGKPDWITNLYTDAIPERMPRISIVCYFDVDDDGSYPKRYHLDSSLAARVAYNAVCDLPSWHASRR